MSNLVPAAALAFAVSFVATPAAAATIEFFAAGTGGVVEDELGRFGDADGSPGSVRFHVDDVDLNADPDRGSYAISFIEITIGPHVFQLFELPDFLGGGPIGFVSVQDDLFDSMIMGISTERIQGQTFGPQAGLLPAVRTLGQSGVGLLVVLDAPDGNVIESDAFPVPVPTGFDASGIFDLYLRDPETGAAGRLTLGLEVDSSTLTSHPVPEPGPWLGALAAAALVLARRPSWRTRPSTILPSWRRLWTYPPRIRPGAPSVSMNSGSLGPRRFRSWKKARPISVSSFVPGERRRSTFWPRP